MTCTYCQKDGHERYFCPLRPTEPTPEMASPFADRLIAQPKIDPAVYAGLPWQEALTTLIDHGNKLNSGNPWRNSSLPRDQLRANLGYWKALGANGTVLSWLAYGLPARVHHEPEHYEFPNHKSYDEHVEYADAEACSYPLSRPTISVRCEFFSQVHPPAAR